LLRLVQVVYTSALLLLLLLSGASMVESFASPATTSGVPRVTTSTTLYYRDDVPPIGSSPHWETPNDFQQFLTQCSIQSFLFLLKSLRDELTMQYLHDFTDPVLLLQVNATTAVTPTPAKPGTKVKVSMAQAAQAALVNTEKALTEGGTVLKQPKAKDDKDKDEDAFASLETTVLADKKKKKKKRKGVGKASKALHSKTKVNQNKKTNLPGEEMTHIRPPLAALKLLKDKAALKTAFSYYTVGRYLAMARKNVAPISNTDITELYSTGIPTKQLRPGKVKSSFSPFAAGKKVTSVPFAGFAGRLKQEKQPAGSTEPLSTSTASLYGPPKKPNVTADTAAAPEKSATVPYRTFPRSNPVALKYHGLAILNRTRFPTWVSYFEQLLEQPKESFLVESYNGHIPSYEMDIDPASLVRRMLSVRLQIAQEFEHDLKVIADMGGEY
jgi:hypothetical protein